MALNLRAWWRLGRFHKPQGILLLWSPVAWALWLANKGSPPLKLFLLFLCGTILMRAAGCVVNDIADRHIDRHVKRTRQRPLTSGEVSLESAFALVLLLLFPALLVLLQLPALCFYYALAALAVTLVYPFCKRVIQAPQLILGVAFSMGIPMAYVASGAAVNKVTVTLLIINFLWIVCYDTQYAIADREDDKRLGVHSTAVWLASYDRLAISVLQVIFHTLWLMLGFFSRLSGYFYWAWSLSGLILIYQYFLLKRADESNGFRAFASNIWYGLILWAGLIMSTPLITD